MITMSTIEGEAGGKLVGSGRSDPGSSVLWYLRQDEEVRMRKSRGEEQGEERELELSVL